MTYDTLELSGPGHSNIGSNRRNIVSTEFMRGLGDDTFDFYGCGDPANFAAPGQVSLLYPHHTCTYSLGDLN